MNPLSRFAHWLHLQWPAGGVEKLPRVDERFRTNVPGVYVVGDLAGIPLLKFSLDNGTRAIRDIVADSSFTPLGGDGTAGVVGVVIIGAGASGMAAAREAQRQGLSFVVLESQRKFATIKDFQVGKPIYTYPVAMEPAGELTVTASVKEALVEELEAQTEDLPVRDAEAERIRRTGSDLAVVLKSGEELSTQRVVVAIGRSGNYRSLGVPGEDLEMVHHRLHDPAEYAHERVLVVGGGDSAAEVVVALTEAGADVTLSYRRDTLTRPKPENVDRVHGVAAYGGPNGGRCTLQLGSQVKRIDEGRAVLRTTEGDVELEVDRVFAMIGREAPLDFFRRSGIQLRNDWGSVG
ncbi:MAG: NAD(P)-binding domain-containing protein, partial [Bacteroidota bacterium]